MRVGWIVAASLLGAGLFGQTGGGGSPDPQPPGAATLDHQGKRLSVSITGDDVLSAPTPALVSGTSVEFGVHAGAGEIPMGTPGYDPFAIDNWIGVRIVEFELKILGQEVGNPSAENDPPMPQVSYEPTPTYGYGVRFSSTHFPDNTQGKIRLRAKFEGYWLVSYDNGQTYVQETSTKELIVEVDIKVYNKAGLVATAVPTGSEAASKAKQCINISGNALEGMNHTVEPKPFDDAQSVSLSQLTELIRKSTVLVGVTHGDRRGIYPSGGIQPQTIEATWPVIKDWVLSPNPSHAPPYNLVVMMACDTTGQDNGKTPAASFEIANVELGPGGTITLGSKNRAYIGWNFSLWADGPPPVLNPGDVTDLAIWTEKFFSGLAEGKTVGEVLEWLKKKKIVPRTGESSSWNSVYARLVGDGNMKLMGVYGGTGTQWILINPPGLEGGTPNNPPGGSQ